MKYEIILMTDMTDPKSIAHHYKSSVIPVSGDILVVQENSAYEVKKRLISSENEERIIVLVEKMK